MTVEMKVSGLTDLARNFKRLGAVAGGETLVGALRAAARPILEDAKARVPVKTGSLRKSIRILVDLDISDDIAATVYVHATWWTAHFIEFGTVNQPAQPFLRPAVDSKEQEAQRNFVKRLKRDVDRAFKPSGKRK